MISVKACLLGVFVALLALSFGACQTPPSQTVMRVESMYLSDSAMWEHIFASEGSYRFDSVPLGVVVPHHSIDVNELNKFYRGLSEITQPAVVFVIGPNHYENGPAEIQTCQSCVYETTIGDVTIDDWIAEKLVADKIAIDQPDTFPPEHAIYSQAPFIKKYFPEAKIVPILLPWKMPIDDVVKFSQWLDENLPAGSLVLGSVDFSHYLPLGAADFHDQTASAVIQNFDFGSVYNLEIDSPSTIYATLDLMRQRGYRQAAEIAHTNSGENLRVPIEETTSHEYWAFFSGEKKNDPGASILSFGNLAGVSERGLQAGWEWDREYQAENDATPLKYFRDLRGKEDRFLTGTDFLVFDFPDSGCRVKQQRGMKISFCKFIAGQESEISPFDEVRAQSADLVYVLWESDQTSGRGAMARQFADSGADIFIGRGIHTVQSCEAYQGSLLCPSLGDVVAAAGDYRGLILGTFATPQSISAYFFPVEVTGGYPRFLPVSEAVDWEQAFINQLKWPVGVETDVQKGLVKVKR